MNPHSAFFTLRFTLYAGDMHPASYKPILRVFISPEGKDKACADRALQVTGKGMAQVCVSPDSPDKPDKALIQSLYLKGLSPKQIQEQTGVKSEVVSTWAYRGRWKQAKTKASVIVSDCHQTPLEGKAENSALAKHSEAVRSGLADVLLRSVEKLQTMTLGTPKAVLKANAELESVVRNAKTVFGWSEGQSQPAVRINILSQMKPAEEPGPVIDVTPAKAENKPNTT